MTTETHGLKFVVDTKDVAKGFRDYQSAVEGIFSSLDKFEDHVVKTMKGVAKAASNKRDVKAFTRAFDGLSNIKIDGSAARKMSTLSQAMSTFKAPSSAQSANTKKFFSALSTLPDLSAAYGSTKNIAGLSAAMANFKAPSSAQSKRIREFGAAVKSAAPAFASLRSVAGISGVANELATCSQAIRGLQVPSKSHVNNLAYMAAALRSFNFANLNGATGLYSFISTISRFKAPTAGQIRNLQNFISAVSNLKIPQNGSQVASVLRKIALAANAANASLGGFKTNLGGFPGHFNSFNRGARTATVQMMGLQNAFSGTFQVGSLLRTLLGSLTIGEVGRKFFEATNSAISFKAAMSVISKETGFADRQLNYVRDTANKFGLDMVGAADSMGKFMISADKAGATVGQAKTIMEGFGTAMAVMGTSTERQKDVFLALQQVMNKGYLASEELNQQLNEHLPGAIGYLREETKRLGVDFNEAMEKKMLNGTQALLFLAKKYRDEFGPSLEEALKRPGTQLTILKNNVMALYQEIGKSGANKGFTELLQKISSYMNPENVKKFADIIGGKLYEYTKKFGDALDWVYQNWDKIKGPLSTTLSLLGKWMLLTATIQIGKALVSPLMNTYYAAQMLLPQLKQVRILMGALATASIASPVAAGGGAALVGPYAALLDVMNRLKMAVAGNGGGVFGIIKTGLKGIGGVLRIVTTGVAGLATAVGVGLAAAFSTATTAANEMTGENYTSMEIIRGSWLLLTDKMTEWWDGAINGINKGRKWLADNLGISIGEIKGGFADLFIYMTAGFQTAFQSVQIVATGVFKWLKSRLSDMAGAFGKLAQGDFIGAAKGFLGLKDSLSDTLKGSLVGSVTAEYAAMFNEKESAIRSGLAKFGAAAGQRARREDQSSGGIVPEWAGDRFRMTDKGTQQIKDLYGEGNAADQYDSSKLLQSPKAKAGKGKKPPTADQLYRKEERELNRLASKADDIMRRFAEDSPVKKVTYDYVNDLTEQAQKLLTNDAFKKWKENLQKDAQDGEITYAGLAEAIKSGAGVQQDVLKELAARWGVSTDDIVSDLAKQDAAYKRHKAEAQKSMEFGYEIIKQEREALDISMLKGRYQEIANKIQQEANRFQKAGWEFGQKQLDQMRTQLELLQRKNDLLEKQRQLFEMNGMRQYVADTWQTANAVAALDKDFLQGFEDTLYRLGTEGKLSFKGLINSMQSDLIRWASQGITKQFMNFIVPGSQQAVANSQNPSIFGGLFKRFSGEDASDPANYKLPHETVGEFGGIPKYYFDTATGSLKVSVVNGPTGGGLASTATSVGSDIDLTKTRAATGPVQNATSAVAQDFQQQMNPAINAVAMAFMVGFNDPIKGIATFFGTMLMQQMLQSGGGGGGFFGSIAKGIGGLFTGGGSVPAAKEGWLTSAPPVTSMSASPAAFINAPHYKDGTANTSGIPAVLHDNEAVIPLTRGRKVPVHLTNDVGNSNTSSVNVTFNVQSPDADSFRKSRQQVMADLHGAATRAFVRNR